MRQKISGDYWTGGIGNCDLYEVYDNNSGSKYSFIFPAITMSEACPMTDTHGVRPVIKINLSSFTAADIDNYWPQKTFLMEP